MKNKYFLSFLLTLSVVAPICSCSPKIEEETELETTKHLVANPDGSYGGSKDIDNYGYGTPLNGEYDDLEYMNEYYNVINYYQRGSTDTRVLYHNFKPYQKTYANTDGIACIVSMLNYFGKDTNTTYSEEALLTRYETLNTEDLKVNAETTKGLSTLLTDLGIENSYYENKSGSSPTDSKNMYKFFADKLNAGKMIIAPFQDGTPGYVLIVGAENMGTDTYYDDLFIIMNPNDVLDHYQDGWFIESSTAFHTW